MEVISTTAQALSRQKKIPALTGSFYTDVMLGSSQAHFRPPNFNPASLVFLGAFLILRGI